MFYPDLCLLFHTGIYLEIGPNQTAFNEFFFSYQFCSLGKSYNVNSLQNKSNTGKHFWYWITHWIHPAFEKSITTILYHSCSLTLALSHGAVFIDPDFSSIYVMENTLPCNLDGLFYFWHFMKISVAIGDTNGLIVSENRDFEMRN